MKKSVTYKFTLCAILSALATIAFIIESLFPPLFLPGARMGVSNIFILLCLVVLGYKYAFITLSVKVLLGSLLSGNFFAVVYALPAGLVSLALETLLFYLIKGISIVSISVAGAVINITVQNLVFCLVTKTTEYLTYLPYLSLIAILGGVVVGLSVNFITKIVPEKLFSGLE